LTNKDVYIFSKLLIKLQEGNAEIPVD